MTGFEREQESRKRTQTSLRSTQSFSHYLPFRDVHVTRFTDAKFDGQANFDRAQFFSMIEFRSAVFAGRLLLTLCLVEGELQR